MYQIDRVMKHPDDLIHPQFKQQDASTGSQRRNTTLNTPYMMFTTEFHPTCNIENIRFLVM